VVSGFKGASFALGPYYQKNLPGNDIKQEITPTFQECDLQCQQTNGCKAWTWNDSANIPNEPVGTCWLKSAASTRSNYPGVVSGRRGASFALGPFYQVNLSGNDMKQKHTPIWQLCDLQCQLTKGCEAWTWNESANIPNKPVGTCWLKSAASTPSNYPGVVSGRRGASFDR